jgi:hypothetical protein
MLVGIAIHTLLGFLVKVLPRNSNSKNKYKKVLLEIFQEIARIYGDEPEFRAAVEKPNTKKEN